MSATRGAKPKLAVIGASHFQLPLIRTAQRMGCEVHAFAWRSGDAGESAADRFYPISITEVDKITHTCREIGIQGICTIASDLATVAVCHVADALGLVGNPLSCMRVSTNKALMRAAFVAAGDPSPQSVLVRADEIEGFDADDHGLGWPLVVKPADRSGSRGITKIEGPDDPISLRDAMQSALEQSFCKEVLVEEYAVGDEFSVEGMSWQGSHHVLAITRKGTTGAPHFIETAHLEPALLDATTSASVKAVTLHALDSLGVRNGASHTELKIAPDGTIRIIEIGARMGGDCIGSHLVHLSTGIDYVRAVVDVALGREPDLHATHAPSAAAVRFLFGSEDRVWYERLLREHPDLVRYSYLADVADGGREVTDSSKRLGHVVLSAPDVRDLLPHLPEELVGTAKGGRA